jgi:hypothetical protein
VTAYKIRTSLIFQTLPESSKKTEISCGSAMDGESACGWIVDCRMLFAPTMKTSEALASYRSKSCTDNTVD